jgi:hypothetical protein
LALILVDSDNRVEKMSTEIKTVTDIQARFHGVHTRMETGTMRTVTAMKTLKAFAAAEIRFWEK